MRNFILLSLLSLASCSVTQEVPEVYNYITPCESDMTSHYNEGYNAGFEAGRARGYETGFEEGKDAGYRQGYVSGYDLGFVAGKDSVQRIIDEIKSGLWDSYLLVNAHKVGGLAQALEQAREESFLKGQYFGSKDGYQLGYKNGYYRAFDSIYTLRLMNGQALDWPFKEVPLTINYREIAEILHQIKAQDIYLEQAVFGKAVFAVQSELIFYLVRRLNLSSDEERELGTRYLEMHDELTAAYYSKYVERCKSFIRDYDKVFYDYRYYYSSDIFLDIIEAGLCAVSDALITYCKSSSTYGSIQGLRLMGSTCDLILAEVLVPLRDYTMKYAIMLDYDHNLALLQKQISSNILEDLVVETRTHSKIIQQDLTLGGGINALVNIEITTVISIGFRPENFQITVDHNQQKINFSLNPAPEIKKVVQQDFQVRDVALSSSSNTGLWNIALAEEHLMNIFNQHKDDPSILAIATDPIDFKKVDPVLQTILIKAAEPALALPHSCYNLTLSYGMEREKELIAIECDKVKQYFPKWGH